MRADIAVSGESIVAVGRDLGPGAREIDATGRLVLPGGIDPHAHIGQVSANGPLNADTLASATTAAAFGGTTTVISFAMMHDLSGYTPYEGREVVGWPETVLSRGRVIVDGGTLLAKPGSGRFLARKAGAAAEPTGRVGPELDPGQNFGAALVVGRG